MPYQVQKGDTIAKVTQLLGMNWRELRRLNHHAVGRSSGTGRWFLREGAVIRGRDDFEVELRNSEQNQETSASRSCPTARSERWIEYTVKPGDTLWALAVKHFHVHVEDLIKDNAIEDPKGLQPGQKIQVRLPSYPSEQDVVASWYGKAHHGKPMANGEPFNMYRNTVAHRHLPLGARIELENPLTGDHETAVVTDRGPYVEGRDLDLSYGLARKLSLVKRGVGRLVMRVMG